MAKEKNNSGLIVLVIVLLLLVLGLGGYIVYDKVLSNKETPVNEQLNNVNDKANTENNDNTSSEYDSISHELSEDLLGSYYNSDYNDIYFTLKADGNADVVASSCSDGALPSKTVPYRITNIDGAIILEIDINSNNEYNRIFIGSKYNSVNYKFQPILPGCVDLENTHYVKK